MPDPPEGPQDTPEKPDRSPQRVTIGPAIETNLAMPLRSAKSVRIGTAVEYDTAMPIRAVGGATVVIAYAVVTHDGWHLAADHHDLIAYGTELALVVALLFVGGRIVAGRLFHSP
jgi:hypothetical protein